MNGNPTKGGINNLRIETLDKELICQTSNCNFENYLLGHIYFSKTNISYWFIEKCKNIVSCVCFNCLKLLLPYDKQFNDN